MYSHNWSSSYVNFLIVYTHCKSFQNTIEFWATNNRKSVRSILFGLRGPTRVVLLHSRKKNENDNLSIIQYATLTSVVRKFCNRRLCRHRQAAMHLRWIGYGHSFTSGWKLLMATFILAQQPACGTLTTGAAPPPPASSDNTALTIYLLCQSP